jgi:hypothetical protein
VDVLWTITTIALPTTLWNMDLTLVFDSSCVVTWWWILSKIGSRWRWNIGKHHWTKHPAQEFFFRSICCSGNKSVATTFCQNNGSWDIVFFVMWSLQIGIFLKFDPYTYVGCRLQKSHMGREREIIYVDAGLECMHGVHESCHLLIYLACRL